MASSATPERIAQPITARSWGTMSVAQQQSMHGLGFTPRSWEMRIEPALRLNSWNELSGTQQQAALVLGWQPQSWHKARGLPAPPKDHEFTWVKPATPDAGPRQFPRLRPDFNTLGLFSQPSYTTIGDQYRNAEEVVERRKRNAGSGLISGAMMNRARGRNFTNGSPRHGRNNDVYFSVDAYTADSDHHLIRERSEHASRMFPDRSFGSMSMSPRAPNWTPTCPAKSVRTRPSQTYL